MTWSSRSLSSTFLQSSTYAFKKKYAIPPYLDNVVDLVHEVLVDLDGLLAFVAHRDGSDDHERREVVRVVLDSLDRVLVPFRVDELE